MTRSDPRLFPVPASALSFFVRWRGERRGWHLVVSMVADQGLLATAPQDLYELDDLYEVADVIGAVLDGLERPPLPEPF